MQRMNKVKSQDATQCSDDSLHDQHERRTLEGAKHEEVSIGNT